jgi:hypothetical protein
MQDAPAFTAVLFGLRGCLVQASNGSPRPPPAPWPCWPACARQVPCIWLDDLSPSAGKRLTSVLPDWLPGLPSNGVRWPAPNACWQALMALKASAWKAACWSAASRAAAVGPERRAVDRRPGRLQPVLRPGLKPMAGHDPTGAGTARGKATLELFGLGVHSVIDHLEALDTCLQDIALRRLKGEKP